MHQAEDWEEQDLLSDMAREPVARFDFAEGRYIGAAAVDDDGTARVEGTAAGWIDGRGNVAREDDAFALGLWVHNGNGRQQSLGVGMQGFANDSFGFGEFNGFAQVHHHDSMADVLNDGEVMRNEEVGDAALLLEVLQKIYDLRLDGDIECTDGFVTDDHLRLNRERPRYPDALTLATAEFVGVTLRVRGVKTDGLQEFGDAFLARNFALGELMNIDSFADDLLDGHARIEGAVGVLKDHLEFAPAGAQFGAVQLANILAVKMNRTGGGFEQADDRAPERGLATTAFAHEAEGLTRLKFEANVVHCFDVRFHTAEEPMLYGKMNLEVVNLEEVLHAVEEGRLRSLRLRACRRAGLFGFKASSGVGNGLSQ